MGNDNFIASGRPSAADTFSLLLYGLQSLGLDEEKGLKMLNVILKLNDIYIKMRVFIRSNEMHRNSLNL